jgi:hypothetical protein
MSLAVTDVLRSRLEDHLAPYGLTAEQLRDQVDDVFGEPLLVVATGSVLAGFGRSTSDIDLYVVVPDEVASTPIVSYPSGARVDTALFGAGTLTERHRQMAVRWPPPDPSSVAHTRRRRSLDCLSRFGLGLPLATDAGDWQSWQRAIESDIAGWLSEWHAAEAVRKQAAARVLLPLKPRLAAQKAAEAMVAALDRRSALAGECYFKSKFVGEKLRRLGDEQGHAWARQALFLPVTVAESAGYVRRADDVVDELLADVDTRGWRLRLTPAAGVVRHGFGRETLVSRWALRAVAVTADSPAVTAESWDYGLTEPWHPDVAGVFAEDMLSLAVAGAAAGSER